MGQRMSVFGTRIALANKLIDDEFAQLFWYQPMQEVINADPIIDVSRQAGECRVIILQPGIVLGNSWGLNQMHERSTSECTLYYMARGILLDVQRFDRFTLRGSAHNPDVATGTRTYEVGDGPRPIGFGRYRGVCVEIPPQIEAVNVEIEFMPEATFAEIEFQKLDLPWM
jgi:hypothetical protein